MPECTFHHIRIYSCFRFRLDSRLCIQAHQVAVFYHNTAYASESFGEKAYKSLLDIKFPVDVVDVFRPSPETPEIARQAVQIKAKALWLQEGIFNDEAKKIAEDNGLLFIMNRCMMKEHYKLF